MRLTIHRRECSLLSDRDRVLQWFEWHFEPRESECRFGPRRWRHFRGASTPVQINAPIGSRVVARGGELRLVTHFEPYGLTAESVWTLARRGGRGFSVA